MLFFYGVKTLQRWAPQKKKPKIIISEQEIIEISIINRETPKPTAECTAWQKHFY